MSKRQGRVALVAGLLVGAGAGGLAALLPSVPSNMSAAALQFVLILIDMLATLAAVHQFRRSFQSGRGFSHFGTALFGAGMMLAVAIPGIQLLSGSRTSLLSRIGGPSVDPSRDLPIAYGIFLLAFLMFLLGQEFAAHRLPPRRSTPSHGQPFTFDSVRTYLGLVAVGTAALIAIHSGQSLQQLALVRGDVRGAGYLDVPAWGLSAALAMGVVSRHWHSKRLLCISLAGFIVLGSLSLNRSSLLPVAIAVLLRFAQASSAPHRSLRYGILAAALLYSGGVAAIAVSNWRADVALGSNAGVGPYLVAAAGNPLTNLDTVGLDTLDGLILATKVDPQRVGAEWYDPSKAILNLVPYQLWPDKPTFLGPTVTRDYTNAGGISGVFLSGPGYLLLIFSGPIGMAVGFAVIGLVSEMCLSRWRRPTCMTALFVYGLVRFIFAGDAYDLFNVLCIALVVIFVWALTHPRALLGTRAKVASQQLGRTPLYVRVR
jgi:hypothetical protein